MILLDSDTTTQSKLTDSSSENEEETKDGLMSHTSNAPKSMSNTQRSDKNTIIPQEEEELVRCVPKM